MKNIKYFIITVLFSLFLIGNILAVDEILNCYITDSEKDIIGVDNSNKVCDFIDQLNELNGLKIIRRSYNEIDNLDFVEEVNKRRGEVLDKDTELLTALHELIGRLIDFKVETLSNGNLGSDYSIYSDVNEFDAVGSNGQKKIPYGIQIT